MKSFMKPCKTETDQGSSTTTTSDPALKRKCKPLLPCAACRRQRLRCDRALPACGNCLDNLPQTESCDYSLTRDYLELLNSRQKTKRLRRHKPSLPTPAPSTASPPPKIKEEEEEDDDDDIDGSVTSATPSTSHDDGDDEDSDSTTKTTHDGLRQKLDRLERLINGLVESHKSSCESKKKQKDLEKAGKLQSRTSEEDLGDNHSNAADDNQSTNSRVEESAWGSFVSEKVTTWQQKLARHPASERSLEHTSSKEHLKG